MITVTADFTVKPEKKAELLSVLDKVIENTRSEKGCITYELYEAQDVPNKFIMIERWESMQALQTHLHMPYIQTLLEKSAEWLEAPVAIQPWHLVK